MDISKETANLLNTTKDQIVDRDYETAYEYVEFLVTSAKEVGEYTAALLYAGINPLLLVKTIPCNYMRCYNANEVTIPYNIEGIDSGAFINANIKLLTIPESVVVINKWAFCYMRGTIKCNSATALTIQDNCKYIDLIEFEVV